MNLARKIKSVSRALIDSRYRYMYWQRAIEDKPKREAHWKRIAASLPQAEKTAARGPSEPLLRDGIQFMDGLVSQQQISDIKSYLGSCLTFDPYRPELGNFKSPDDAPPKTHVAQFQQADIAKMPHIMDIANNPRVIDAVTDFLGCKPTISLFLAWWSLPAHDGAQEAENFHRDYDDFRFAKLFLYLCDVTQDNGPHVFVKGSLNSDKLFARKRYTDSEVLSSFPNRDDHLTLTGTEGTAFVESTFGLHRGVPPKSKPRLIMQVLYTLKPNFSGPSKPLLTLPQTDAAKYDAYSNRIYCRFK